MEHKPSHSWGKIVFDFYFIAYIYYWEQKAKHETNNTKLSLNNSCFRISQRSWKYINILLDCFILVINMNLLACTY